MIKVELTEDTGNFPVGMVLSLDDNSANALIGRGHAKLVDAPAAPVAPGGTRARELNKQNPTKTEPTQEAETDGDDEG